MSPARSSPSDRTGSRPGSVRQPLRDVPLVSGDRRAATRGSGRRDAQTRRERILNDTPSSDGHPLMFAAQAWNYMFPLGDPPNYEPAGRIIRCAGLVARGQSVGGGLRPSARRRWTRNADRHPCQFSRQLSGHHRRADPARRRGARPRRRRCALRNDLRRSFPTYLLTHGFATVNPDGFRSRTWVKELTSVPARIGGLKCTVAASPSGTRQTSTSSTPTRYSHWPTIKSDLPAGGRRLDQTADGDAMTMVSGEIISENGEPTAARPELIRGRQPAPANA